MSEIVRLSYILSLLLGDRDDLSAAFKKKGTLTQVRMNSVERRDCVLS